MTSFPPLGEHECRIYVARPSDPAVLARAGAYEAMLAPEEVARRGRYRFERHRHEYLVTRALARCVLGGLVGVAPERLGFRAGQWGKPAIESPPGARWLSFNLSNTDGMVVCIVATSREVGVDVERVDRGGELLDVADRYFAPAEVRALRELPAEKQLARFFVYWTLKEAYIKARGMGLAIPLADFAFDVDVAAAPSISFAPALVDDPQSWSFGTTTIGGSHRVSHAARVVPGERPTVTCHDCVP